MTDDFTLEPTVARSVQRQPTGVKRAIAAYYEAFVRRFNPREVAEAWLADPKGTIYDPLLKMRRPIAKEDVTIPLIDGAKDGANLKRMMATWGEERVVWLCANFPFIKDHRVESSDMSLGALKMHAQHLMLRRNGHGTDKGSRNRQAIAQAIGEKE